MRNLLKYRPCELVQGKKRWYIKYYQTNPKTGKRIALIELNL
jgi:hypothetical protein